MLTYRETKALLKVLVLRFPELYLNDSQKQEDKNTALEYDPASEAKYFHRGEKTGILCLHELEEEKVNV